MKKIVVKIGSSVIAPKGKLNPALVNQIVRDILESESLGYKVVLVSSGAIASGVNALGLKRKPADIHSLMAIASYGQIVLMDTFNSKFKKYKRRCAQILLSWDDFDIRSRFVNIRTTIDKLLAMDIVPIINENDAVSCEEIRFGDNDSLSARVAVLVGAQKLIMLSDVEGLFDKTKLIKEVSQVTSDITSLAKKEDKTHTSGGMITKLQAAEMATSSGIRTIIAKGSIKSVISKIINGETLGTLFCPSQSTERERKKWIVSKKIRGKIFIDQGAKDALLNKGKSLLNVGIASVEGCFKKDDAVAVVDEQGKLLGFGLTHYPIEELKNKTKKKLAKAVIHRDNFTKSLKGFSYHSCTISSEPNK
ncbi:MAG: glutamate 5-kinase [Candidatus Omnitrophica bacterium]|nr:glutamate 5-kinase [Candidatus Omnitrophota bacterium]